MRAWMAELWTLPNSVYCPEDVVALLGGKEGIAVDGRAVWDSGGDASGHCVVRDEWSPSKEIDGVR